jgi:hypothetical protein
VERVAENCGRGDSRMIGFVEAGIWIKIKRYMD